MSLVERAIDKLRRTAVSEQTEVTAPIVGSLVVAVDPPLADSPVPASAPGRRILVNRESLRESGYLPDSTTERQFADYYRQIKRPLIAKALATPEPGRPNPRLIMMASALPGDGKTFTSINLALSMARERDVSVVLVDVDIPKPHISRIFGVEDEPGLLEAIGEEALDVESLILPTDVRGFSILPAGKPHEGATELLASARMAQVVTRMLAKDPQRIVLFDSPPLLVSSEANALSPLTGQIVLVVCSGKTPRHAVLNAYDQISNHDSVSLVLNQGRPGVNDGYYGYAGSYGRSGSQN